MKFVTATKYGGSIVVSLTGIAKEGDEYLVNEKGGQIILTPSKQAYKVLKDMETTVEAEQK